MRLACPNCDARYEVPDDAIPEGGRDVQCSSCGHAWFQQRPEVEEAAEAEAALYGDDLPAPEAEPALPAAAAAPAAAAPGASAALEDSVLAVLREEAQREAEARRAEAQRQEARRAEAERQMQTQPDLGIEAAVQAAVAEGAAPEEEPAAMRDPDPVPPPAAAAAAAPAAMTATQRRLAMLKGEDPDAPPPAPARVTARRDLLPDVEEINSTLQPSDSDGAADVDALPDLTKRSGFRTGFLLALFVLGVAAVIYVAAPSIVASVPALEGPMTAYVAAVDGLRVWLNDLMSSATDSLNPATGP